MNESKPPQRLLEKIREHLDLGCKEIDPRITAALSQGRFRALESPGRQLWLGLPRWIPVSGLATVTMVAFALVLWLRQPQPAVTAIAPDDLEVVTSAEQIDLYRDLDFYQWLEGRGNAQ